MAKRKVPEVNAGSMADIAFLLLIFFLVTTTMDVDSGLPRRLPQMIDSPQDVPPIKKKNVLTILINAQNDILLGNDIAQVSDIRQRVIDFVDNNGDGTCEACMGSGNPESSDNPTKAVVSLTNDRGTSYGTYIAVQNEIVSAYNFLRDRLTKEKFGKPWKELEREEIESQGSDEELSAKVKLVKEAYPLNISEAEPVNYSK